MRRYVKFIAVGIIIIVCCVCYGAMSPSLHTNIIPVTLMNPSVTIELAHGWPELITVEDKCNKFAIPLTLQLKDGETVLMEVTEYIYYRTGQDIAEIRAETILKLQADIDKYEAEKSLNDSSVLDNSVTTIKNNLSTNL